MAEKELKEFQADGENSSIADPIAKDAGSRKADVFKSANPKADSVEDLEGQNKGEKLIGSQKSVSQAPARKADKRTVKESVDEIFEGEEFSEEFKAKIGAIFEAALIERVAEEAAEIEEAFNEKLDEEIAALNEGIEEYLDYVVEQWLEENEVGIESATKVAMAESFMDDLKGLFEAHNVILPEGGLDIVEGLEARIAELETDLNESEAKSIELTKQLSEATEAEIVAEISEGLTETQKDRLTSLAENIEYANVDEFRTKITTIKESFVAKKTVGAEETLNEEFEGDVTEAAAKVDPTMASYLSAVSRTLKK
jgi:hypothetical protein